MSLSKDEFRDYLKDYVKYNEEIEKINAKLKKLKKKKEEFSPYIMEYMEENNIDNINFNSNYSLKRKKTSSYETVNKKYIINNLTKYLKSEDKAEKIAENIYDSREKVTKSSLVIEERKK